MTDGARRLAETLANPEAKAHLETWLTNQAVQAQDQAVAELIKREPSLEAAVQYATTSKVYERLLAELTAAFKV